MKKIEKKLEAIEGILKIIASMEHDNDVEKIWALQVNAQKSSMDHSWEYFPEVIKLMSAVIKDLRRNKALMGFIITCFRTVLTVLKGLNDFIPWGRVNRAFPETEKAWKNLEAKMVKKGNKNMKRYEEMYLLSEKLESKYGKRLSELVNQLKD